MTSLPILPLNEDHPARQQFCHAELPIPDFYMSDYSLLGLMVDDYERTLKLLNDKHLPLKWTTSGVEFPFRHSGQLQDLVLFLQSKGINCGLSDVAEQIYQG